MPVGEAAGLPGQQRFGRLSVLAEVLAEAAFGAGEVNEVNLLFGLGVLVPVLFVEACCAPSIHIHTPQAPELPERMLFYFSWPRRRSISTGARNMESLTA